MSECVCLCAGRGRLQTDPTLHSSDSSSGGPIPPDPRTFCDPSPDRAALCWGHVTLRSRGWGSPPGRSPRCSRGAQPFCESPQLWLLTRRGPASLSGGRKERLLRAVSLAWALPPRGPGTVPFTGPGTAACVPFPASRGPGEARGEDLKVRLDQGAGQLSVRRSRSW